MIAARCSGGRTQGAGFILLPVVLALSLIASVAYLANRDSAVGVAMVAGGTDRLRARYAAEAGLQHANHAAQQLDCALSLNSAVEAEIGGAPYTASSTEVVYLWSHCRDGGFG